MMTSADLSVNAYSDDFSLIALSQFIQAILGRNEVPESAVLEFPTGGRYSIEASRRSEKNANRKQPENYKEEETDDKIVEIGSDLEDDPIKGIDPPEGKGGR